MLSKYENGVHEPGLTTLSALSDLLGVSCHSLLSSSSFGQEEAAEGNCLLLGVAESIPPGDAPRQYTEELTEVLKSAGLKYPLEACRMADDSMHPFLQKGDTLIVSREKEPREGSIHVCYCHKNEMTVIRRVALLEDGLALTPENRYYPVWRYTQTEYQNGVLEVLGRVTQVRRSMS